VTCPHDDILGAFLAGELPPAERAKIVDHAATCEQCRAVVAAAIDSAPTPGNEPTLGAAAGGDDIVAPGDRVGRYVIEHRLGVGGMGVVYAAVDSDLHRRVAVKLLRDEREAGFGSQGRERLLREARTLAKLSHPNVVTVFDVGVHRDQLYIAMELVDGGNLSAWLRRAPRTTREVIDRMREAGAGLAAAHAAGVVHRDVKPDNILVGEDGRARMTDFGLARSTDTAAPSIAAPAGTTPVPEAALTRTHAMVGTPVYMAPEQLTGASADARSDQWSFCATLYEAIAGVRPFAPGDIDSRRSAIASASVAAPMTGRRMPRWVRRIALRGLRADPAERWPSVSAIVDALGRSRQRRAVLVLAGLLVVALGAVAVVAVTRAPAKATTPRGQFTSPDRRGGCDCPYAACVDGQCVGECDPPNYRLGTPVPGITTSSHQEALLGASVDGDAILYASGERCAVDRLMLARRRGPTFVPVDLTDRINPLLGGAQLMEGAATLAPDGRSIIVLTADKKRLVRARLGDGDEIVGIDRDELAGITPPLPGTQTLGNPVLSYDQLTVYYVVNDHLDGDFGPLHGIYESVRADPRSPFPRGSRMPGRIRSYNYVSGITRDGLALFVTGEYSNRVLMRASTREPFGDPAPTVLPPVMHGWRAVPLAGCQRILSTDTPGGCAAEDIVYIEALPKRRR
jgi:hypothetical protein